MLSKFARARSRYSLPLLLVFSVCLLTVGGLFMGSVGAKGQPAVWRGNSKEGNYSFRAIRTAPTVAWQRHLPTASLFAPPILDGTTLFVVSQDEVLRALDVNTQAEKWSMPAKGGIHAGMIVDDDTIYYGSEGGYFARDKATGALKWSFAAAGTVFAAPSAANDTIYFTQSTGVVYAISMSTGQEKWHTNTTGSGINPVAYGDGAIYVSINSAVIAFDASNGSEKWRVTVSGGDFYGPVLSGGVVYVPHDNGNLYALNAATGAEIWKVGIGGQPVGSGGVANGLVYLGNKSNRLIAVSASDGHEVWHFDGDDWPTYPSIVSGVLYVGTTNHEDRNGERNLYALDAASGAELWRFKADSRLFNPPAFTDDAMYLQSWNGTLYALTAAPAVQATPTSGQVGISPTPAAPVPTVAIPGDDIQTFPETGKTVKGLFLEYWQQHGGLAQQGYPISELMGEVSALDGKAYTVQYFERAVFEYHPEQAAPYNVLLSQLGTFRYKANYPEGAAGQAPNNALGSQLFAETGHRVGGKFLEYWKANGGLAQQGYPISDEFQEVSDLDGKPYKVQYFERAVFELHPENAAPYDVLLSQLGTFRYKEAHGPAQAGPVAGLFDVGGYKLWLDCRGQGSPTVLLDSELGGSSGSWSLVQPDLAGSTRVCSYDRANLGKSERGTPPRTAQHMMQELHALLAAAQVGGSYVLVGQAEGGLNMQMFAKMYSTETTGIVLVDAVHPDLDARYAAILTPDQEAFRHTGISQTREGVTYEETNLSGKQVREAGPLPNVPLVVLRHGLDLPQPPGWPVAEIERIWLQMQQELAAMIPGGQLVVAENSRHYIAVNQPEIVIRYVNEVVSKVRGK